MFHKAIQNTRKQIDIQLVTNGRTSNKLASSVNFKGRK